MCEILCFWHPRVQLKSKHKQQLMIMSTMILDSPENIRLRKEMPLWANKIGTFNLATDVGTFNRNRYLLPITYF